MTLQPRVFDLNAIVRGLKKMLRRVPENKSHHPHRTRSRLRERPVQMEQVLLKPAVNARDAMPRWTPDHFNRHAAIQTVPAR
jgi:hypothetical protein